MMLAGKSTDVLSGYCWTQNHFFINPYCAGQIDFNTPSSDSQKVRLSDADFAKTSQTKYPDLMDSSEAI